MEQWKQWKQWAIRWFTRCNWRMTARLIGSGVAGAFLGLLAVGILVLNQKEDLEVWHTADLDGEFEEGSGIRDFAGYLALEDALFEQLETLIYDEVAPSPDIPQINRYQKGSLSDPTSLTPNWNRTFQLKPEGRPGMGVLLLHGLSDSPYSLRTIGQRLRAEGAHVIGLRIPGHGTAPSSLTSTRWEDMAAAVELAAVHLSEAVDGAPIHLVGYSNGGALAVHYALTAIEDTSLPQADRLALLSPEIGISPMAALAVWQERIGRILRLEKLAWTGVALEYDPYKYTSFPVNAGNLAHQLTRENRRLIGNLRKQGRLTAFPSTMVFQSSVDATVSTPAIVLDLFSNLPEGGHELVVYDINRRAGIDPLLTKDPMEGVEQLRTNVERAFAVSLLTNRNPDTAEVVQRRWEVDEKAARESATGLSWPIGIYSLSHVALPFPEDDPVYGGSPPADSPGIHIGSAALRGERGVIRIPAADMLRLRWNPFHSHQEKRILEFLAPGQNESPIP